MKKKSELKKDINEEVIDEEEQITENNELTNLENQLKRALADYQNLERRISAEKAIWIKTANKSLILKLLAVLDNLFLAQKHIQDDGLSLSIQKFLDVLSEEGVSRIESTGRDFDPQTMECVSVQEGENGKVLEEVRPGFIINNETLRPAQVIVGGQKN
jgi:molecular chaperone GrpE